MIHIFAFVNSERIWSEMFPRFVSRACTKYSLAKESVEVAAKFLLIASTSPSSSTMSRWDALQELVFNVDLTFLWVARFFGYLAMDSLSFRFRTMFLRRLFNDSTLLTCLLSSLIIDIEQAWQFYATWLTFRLLSSNTTDEHKILRDLLSDRNIELPDGVSDFLDTADAEISMIRLCNRFDAAEVSFPQLPPTLELFLSPNFVLLH